MAAPSKASRSASARERPEKWRYRSREAFLEASYSLASSAGRWETTDGLPQSQDRA